MRWGDLRVRVVSALVLGPAALACVWLGGVLFGAMMALVGVLLIAEWRTLTRGRLSGRWVWIGTAYLAGAVISFSLLRGTTDIGRVNLLFVIAVVWSADIGAYAVGRLAGGPKLAPAISPGKTWSGAAGGTMASMIAGVGVAGTGLGVAGPVALALLLSVAAQVGDLAESALKRRLGVKDSGTLIPGHGGLLDRLGRHAAGDPGGGPSGGLHGTRCRTLAMKTVTVLGSTGSVGTQTVDLLTADRDRYRLVALVGGRNVAVLAAQARALRPQLAVICDPACHRALADALSGTGVEVASGERAVVEAAAIPADWTMAAIAGAAGLPATLAAIRNGRAVAFANKEALVCAGEVMLDAVRAHGATLLPVDSEHNAIFQAMADGNRGAVERITLTASGGPFRTASRDEMARATPEMALKHPVWSMGAKISIDSATMMNKGLELIEAARLFDFESDRIDVLIHPQSVVHGLVQYSDGSVLAQLGSPDMRVPIAHTLAWPGRIATTAPRLDLAAVGRLEFAAPDLARFPALRIARDALVAGGGVPTVLSAANEVAVAAFLERRIGFLDIADIVESVVSAVGPVRADTLDDVHDLDARARRLAEGACASASRTAA